MGITVELDYEATDEITRVTLIDAYDTVDSQIDELKYSKAISELKDFEKEDLRDSKKIRKALRRVIKYYSTPQQFKEFENIYGS